jgi:hypothetical protein
MLPLNTPSAAWRSISDYHQLSMLARAQNIQLNSALKKNFSSQDL